jgi:hypothetical protein
MTPLDTEGSHERATWTTARRCDQRHRAYPVRWTVAATSHGGRGSALSVAVREIAR